MEPQIQIVGEASQIPDAPEGRMRVKGQLLITDQDMFTPDLLTFEYSKCCLQNMIQTAVSMLDLLVHLVWL